MTKKKSTVVTITSATNTRKLEIVEQEKEKKAETLAKVAVENKKRYLFREINGFLNRARILNSRDIGGPPLSLSTYLDPIHDTPFFNNMIASWVIEMADWVKKNKGV